MSVIVIPANRSVIVVEKGVIGSLGLLSRFTIGQLAPFTILQLAVVQ